MNLDEFLKTGSHCPVCFSDCVGQTSAVAIDRNEATCHSSCSECGAEWTEVWGLVGVRDVVDGHEQPVPAPAPVPYLTLLEQARALRRLVDLLQQTNALNLSEIAHLTKLKEETDWLLDGKPSPRYDLGRLSNGGPREEVAAP